MSAPHILLETNYSMRTAHPFTAKFEDLEGRAAFTMSEVSGDNKVFRLTREATWSQQHPNVMGPDNSYFYLGPGDVPGHVAYGNNGTEIHMQYLLQQKRDGSTSRYFMTQSGRSYKWRITPQRMECMDGRTTLAVWELNNHPDGEYYARLTIKTSGFPLVTEILTTLILNRMSRWLSWETG